VIPESEGKASCGYGRCSGEGNNGSSAGPPHYKDEEIMDRYLPMMNMPSVQKSMCKMLPSPPKAWTRSSVSSPSMAAWLDESPVRTEDWRQSKTLARVLACRIAVRTGVDGLKMVPKEVYVSGRVGDLRQLPGSNLHTLPISYIIIVWCLLYTFV